MNLEEEQICARLQELVGRAMKTCDVVMETLCAIGADPGTNDFIRAQIEHCLNKVKVICEDAPEPDPVATRPVARSNVLPFRKPEPQPK